MIVDCPECGKETRPGAAYCHSCGARIHPPEEHTTGEDRKRCLKCDKPLGDKANFCGNCGAKVPKPPPPERIRKCFNCGGDAEKGMRYCPQCGVEFISERPPDISCPMCGEILPAESKYCIICGHKLPSNEPADIATAASTSTSGAYQLPRMLMDNPLALSVIAALLLISSCYLRWGSGPYIRELPLVLIIFNYLIAAFAVITGGVRKPSWLAFLMLGIIGLCVEFLYFLGLRVASHMTFDEIIKQLNPPHPGVIIHLIGLLMLFVNSYFARLKQKIAFSNLVLTRTKWQY